MKTVGEIAKSRGRAYKCMVCGEVGTQRGMVWHFIRRHAPLEQVPFSCSLCGYRACRLGHLKKQFSTFADHKKAAEGISVSDDECIQKAEVPYRVRWAEDGFSGDLTILSPEASQAYFSTKVRSPLIF